MILYGLGAEIRFIYCFTGKGPGYPPYPSSLKDIRRLTENELKKKVKASFKPKEMVFQDDDCSFRHKVRMTVNDFLDWDTGPSMSELADTYYLNTRAIFKVEFKHTAQGWEITRVFNAVLPHIEGTIEFSETDFKPYRRRRIKLLSTGTLGRTIPDSRVHSCFKEVFMLLCIHRFGNQKSDFKDNHVSLLPRSIVKVIAEYVMAVNEPSFFK